MPVLSVRLTTHLVLRVFLDYPHLHFAVGLWGSDCKLLFFLSFSRNWHILFRLSSAIPTIIFIDGHILTLTWERRGFIQEDAGHSKKAW